MVFSSLTFLLIFLPLVLAVHFVLPRRTKNVFLLGASLFFYAWGEKQLVALMLFSIAINYLAGRAVERWRGGDKAAAVLRMAIFLNLAILASVKYANFLVTNLNAVLEPLGVPAISLDPIPLPIGISFYTFQAMSYVIDVYRGQTRARANPIDVGLYVALFPQLIAGPIVRFHDVAQALVRRRIGLEGMACGVERFIVGLSKKVLVANTLAVPADAIFALPGDALCMATAWFGVLCYGLQLYFDFSGYSDMAIGLGKMLGFQFHENFRYPYTAKSMTEFWRRWHISLATWFRDYVYIPLGGNRRGLGRTYVNLAIVFFLCGLWHGASWNYVIWGLYHGLFLATERAGWGTKLANWPRGMRHGYTLLIVSLGWVLFRAETLPQAWHYLQVMTLGGTVEGAVLQPISRYANPMDLLVLVCAVAGSGPVLPALGRIWTQWTQALRSNGNGAAMLESATGLVWFTALMILSLVVLASGAHNPFIYFRF